MIFCFRFVLLIYNNDNTYYYYYYNIFTNIIILTFFIPLSKHFFNRHLEQNFLVILSIWQASLNGHFISYILWRHIDRNGMMMMMMCSCVCSVKIEKRKLNKVKKNGSKWKEKKIFFCSWFNYYTNILDDYYSLFYVKHYGEKMLYMTYKSIHWNWYL